MNPETHARLEKSLPHPDSVTAAQVDTLLRVAGTLLNVLLNPARDMEKIPGETNPSGDIKTSAEATFINVCNRLDTIVTDPERFSLSFQKAVEQRTEDTQRYNMELLKNQSEAAQEIKTPHFRFRPMFVKTEAGDGWIAFLGDPVGDPENAIFGVGRTPSEAIVAFDQVFQGELPIKMLDWLKEREAALTAGIPFPTSPNQNINETKTRPVDPRRNRKTRQAKGGRRNPSSNSGNPS